MIHGGRRRLLLVLPLLLAACGPPGPPPVDVDLGGVNPEAATLIRDLRQAAAGDAGNGDTRGALGLALEANGMPRAAIETYLQAAALAPNDPRWTYHASIASAQLGELEAALAAIDRSLAIDDGYVPAHLFRGAWLLDLGRVDQAQAAYERAVRLDPNSRAAGYGLARVHLQRDNGPEALAILERLHRQGNPDRYLQQLLGLAYRETGDLERAREALALGRGSTRPPTWPDPRRAPLAEYARGYGAEMRRADAYLELGRWQDAATTLERLREHNPTDPDLLTNLALAYRHLGRVEESVEILELGLQHHPDHVLLLANRSVAHEQRGEVDAALEYLDRAIELNPTLGFVHQRKGAILLYGLRRIDEAVASFQQAVTLDSGSATTHVDLGIALGEAERLDEAVEQLELALTIDPTLQKALLPLAFYRIELQQLDRAAAVIERAERFAPGSPEVARMRDRLEQKRGELR